MSGGGGSSGPGGDFGSRNERTRCEELRFPTSIASPQPAAHDLNISDVLQVVLHPGPPPVIHLIDGQDNVVGSVIDRIADLLRCIQDGFRYEAEVKTINGGDIQVEVRSA